MNIVMSWRDEPLFDQACLKNQFVSHVRRRHSMYCHPCPHPVHGPEMTDAHLWSQWNLGISHFVRALIVQMKRFIGDTSPDPASLETESLLRDVAAIEALWKAKAPQWLDAGKGCEYLCYQTYPRPTDHGIDELLDIDDQMYQLGSKIMGMEPAVANPTADNADPARSVVFSFGLLGFANIRANPRHLLSEHTGPLPAGEIGNTVLRLVPWRFLQRVLNEFFRRIDHEIWF